MKKILAVLMAATFVFAVASCTEKTNTDNNKPENESTNTEQVVTPEVPEVEQPENDTTIEGAVSLTDGIPKSISYEKFKEVIGYSMFPYDTPANTEKNMVHSVSGYNGDVELTYFSFVMKENADAYFDEIKSYFPDQIVMSEEDGDYEICKMEDGEYYYMMVRIDKTIIYGSCRDGYDSLNTWLYGLGYITKK